MSRQVASTARPDRQIKLFRLSGDAAGHCIQHSDGRTQPIKPQERMGNSRFLNSLSAAFRLEWSPRGRGSRARLGELE